jgi:hypothetical protein
MKNLRQISKILAILLIAAAVLGLLAWRFLLPESELAAVPKSAQTALPQPAVITAQTSATQTSATQNSTVAVPVTPVVAPVTEPVVAAVAESATESAEDLHDHDAQNQDEPMPPPSPEIINAIRDMKKPTPNEGQMIQNPDGSVKVNLGNRFQSVPIATIGKDGKVHVDYHGEKYVQDNQAVENSKPEQQKQEAATP